MAQIIFADRTYNSKNPLMRLSHRTRLKKSIEQIPQKDGLRILDIGCGDGFFLNQLKESAKDTKIQLVGFEPYMKSINKNTIEIYKDWNEVLLNSNNNGKFDYLTCFEVLEHLNSYGQKEILKKIIDVAHEKSKIIISVPIEKGPPAIIKNLIRRINYPQKKNIYNLRNITKSVFKKPIPECREGQEYLSHMGFYFDDLESIINKYFVIEKKEFSPFRYVGYYFNSQVFYTLLIKKKLVGNTQS